MRNVIKQRALVPHGLVFVTMAAVLMFVSAASASFATTGNISGTVNNRSNGSPVVGATVAVGSQVHDHGFQRELHTFEHHVWERIGHDLVFVVPEPRPKLSQSLRTRPAPLTSRWSLATQK